MNKIKVALVGAGSMAKEHAKAFASIEGVELVGIQSRTREKAQVLASEHGMAAVASNVSELYEKTRADAVIVCVPVLQTETVCEEVFKFPWKALIEKPAGHDLAAAQRVLGSAAAHGRQAYVALNRRHFHSTRTLLGELAKSQGPRFIHMLDQQDLALVRKLGHPEEVARTWMYANSIHLIDYFSFLGRGSIVAVDPIVRWSPENPFHVVGKISYSSGDVGLYEAAWNRPGPWSATVTVPEARYELRPMEQIGVQAQGSRKLEVLPCHEWDTQFKPGFRVQAQELINAVKGESHALPSLQEALSSMEMVQRLYS